MTPGDIAISAMPQADGIIKLRPLAVLSEFPRHGDLLVCGITSQMWNFVDGFDVAIRKGEPDFEKSGLMRWPRFLDHLLVKISDGCRGLVCCYRGRAFPSISFWDWSPIIVSVAQGPAGLGA